MMIDKIVEAAGQGDAAGLLLKDDPVRPSLSGRSRRSSDAGRTLPLNGLGRGAGLACTTASGGANDGMQWGA
jgi:hypothetical protein